MLKQLNITDLIAAVQDRIKTGTGVDALDHVPDDQPSPFYFVSLVNTTPANTKTMFVTQYNLYIHSIAAESDSSVGVLNMIDALDSALTEDIILPEGYTLISQTNNGVQSIYTEETGEKHGVSSYSFKVSYGFKTKV